MSATATFILFTGQNVASLMRQLSGVQIVATVSRQFRKANKRWQGLIPPFRIVSTLSTQLVRPSFYAPGTVASVSFAVVIGVNDE